MSKIGVKCKIVYGENRRKYAYHGGVTEVCLSLSCLRAASDSFHRLRLSCSCNPAKGLGPSLTPSVFRSPSQNSLYPCKEKALYCQCSLQKLKTRFLFQIFFLRVKLPLFLKKINDTL